MSHPVACIYKGYLYWAHEFPNGIPANSVPLFADRLPLSDDEIDDKLGWEPLDYRAGFHDGVRCAETIHLHQSKP